MPHSTIGTILTDSPSPSCHHGDMDTRHELQQALWEVIAEMERARLQGDDDQARRLEGIGWQLVGILGMGQSGKSGGKIKKTLNWKE